MEGREVLGAITIIVLAVLVLAFSVTFNSTHLVYVAALSFLVIIVANILTKKAVGYYFETTVKTRFWSLYYFWFRKDSHFKKPVPMIWLPLVISLVSKGWAWWLGVLEFDIEAKTSRVSRKHGLYRFTEVTEWHMAWIATWGIIANLALAIIGYFLGFEFFTKLSIYYATWSMVPISGLDGSKIFFGSKGMWVIMAIITLLFLWWGIAL